MWVIRERFCFRDYRRIKTNLFVMKKFLVAAVAAMMLFSTNSFAQFGFGGGFTSMAFGGGDAKTYAYDDVTLPGFYFGVNYDFAFSTIYGLTVEPGIYLEHFGKTFDYLSKAQRATYIKIPLNLKYKYYVMDDIAIGGYTGPRFDFGFGSAMNKTTASNAGLGLKPFDASWGIGVFFSYADAVQLRIGYDWGFNKEIREPLAEAKIRRNSFHIGLNFMFANF